VGRRGSQQGYQIRWVHGAWEVIAEAGHTWATNSGERGGSEMRYPSAPNHGVEIVPSRWLDPRKIGSKVVKRTMQR
jgi:hypothetical protein